MGAALPARSGLCSAGSLTWGRWERPRELGEGGQRGQEVMLGGSWDVLKELRPLSCRPVVKIRAMGPTLWVHQDHQSGPTLRLWFRGPV